MRVALVQCSLDRKSGANNTRLLSAAIDRAADVEHAPDLLVLPADCDTGGSQSAVYAAALRASLRELIAGKAREWGVLIAAGVRDDRGSAPSRCAVLFDADGDIVASTDSSFAGARFHDTAVGRIGLHPLESPLRAPVEGAELQAGLTIALPRSGRRSDEKFIESLIGSKESRGGASWVIVMPAGSSAPEGAPATSFVISPAGQIVAEVASTEVEVLHVELALESAS